jgi:hypothetical protein
MNYWPWFHNKQHHINHFATQIEELTCILSKKANSPWTPLLVVAQSMA